MTDIVKCLILGAIMGLTLAIAFMSDGHAMATPMSSYDGTMKKLPQIVCCSYGECHDCEGIDKDQDDDGFEWKIGECCYWSPAYGYTSRCERMGIAGCDL